MLSQHMANVKAWFDMHSPGFGGAVTGLRTDPG